MRRIFPNGGEESYIGPTGSLIEPVEVGDADTAGMIADLAACYAYPDGLWVRANMVTSLDGAIAIGGRSGGLSGAADRALFHVLRSLADVILVGAGTARAERYGLAKPGSIWPQLRQGRPATPPIAVVTRGIGLDLHGPLIHGDDSLPRTIVLTTSHAPADRVATAAKTAQVIVAGEDEVSAKSAIDALTKLGHRRILVEGGPTLLGQLVSANLVDDLCVTISPLIADGHGPRMIVQHGPVDVTRLRLATLIEDDGFLLSRYVRRASEPS